MLFIDWCCSCYFVKNSLVALLEALCDRIFSFRFVNIGFVPLLFRVYLTSTIACQCHTHTHSDIQKPWRTHIFWPISGFNEPDHRDNILGFNEPDHRDNIYVLHLEGSKQNYYIMSWRVIIKAIFSHLYLYINTVTNHVWLSKQCSISTFSPWHFDRNKTCIIVDRSFKMVRF